MTKTSVTILPTTTNVNVALVTVCKGDKVKQYTINLKEASEMYPLVTVNQAIYLVARERFKFQTKVVAFREAAFSGYD